MTAFPFQPGAPMMPLAFPAATGQRPDLRAMLPMMLMMFAPFFPPGIGQVLPLLLPLIMNAEQLGGRGADKKAFVIATLRLQIGRIPALRDDPEFLAATERYIDDIVAHLNRTKWQSVVEGAGESPAEPTPAPRTKSRK